MGLISIPFMLIVQSCSNLFTPCLNITCNKFSNMISDKIKRFIYFSGIDKIWTYNMYMHCAAHQVNMWNIWYNGSFAFPRWYNVNSWSVSCHFNGTNLPTKVRAASHSFTSCCTQLTVQRHTADGTSITRES